jgi:hypothetical protein
MLYSDSNSKIVWDVSNVQVMEHHLVGPQVLMLIYCQAGDISSVANMYGMF